MEKRLKLGLFLFLISIILFSLSFVSANFEKGNLTYNIKENYGPGDYVEGWINLSLNNINKNAELTSNFQGNKKLINLLEENEYIIESDFTCNTFNCVETYLGKQGSSEKTKQVYGTEVFVFNLTGAAISAIDGSSYFKISSDNEPSCVRPFKFSIGDSDFYEYKKLSGDFSCGPYYSCFDKSLDNYNILKLDSIPYCSNFSLIYNSDSIIVGAWAKKNGTGNGIKIEVYSEDKTNKGFCLNQDISEQGDYFECEINSSFFEKASYYVCISPEYVFDGESNYSIKTEDSGTNCGFHNSPDLFSQFTLDYDFYVKTPKYIQPDLIVNNQEFSKNTGTSLSDAILSYLNKYNGCEESCYVPLKIYSSTGQNIRVYDININYGVTDHPSRFTNKIYDAEIEDARISSGFLKLDINNIFKISSSYGTRSFNLKLDNQSIFNTEISVADVPKLLYVSPTIIGAGINTNIYVIADVPSDKNITKYKWDFGDNSSIKTTEENKVSHIYNEVGTYDLKVEVEYGSGEEISKVFEINVEAGEDAAEKMIENAKSKISSIKTKINSYWFKNKLKEQLNIDLIESELNNLESDLEIATEDKEYADIINNVSDLDIPNSIVSSVQADVPFYNKEDNIDLIFYDEITQNIDLSRENSYKKALLNWFIDNVDINLEYEKIVADYGNKIEFLYSYFKFKVNKVSEPSLLILNENFDEIIFKELYSERKILEKTYISFENPNTFEFILDKEKDFNEIEAYVAPEYVSSLELEPIVGVCNFNGICEDELGETWKNCRSDCKPVGWTIFYIVLLLFFALVVYIILQEWYKRKYEKHLFKNQNDLYNLINFIHNARQQSLDDGDIKKQLRKQGWKGEQIKYAIRKYEGKRTGMWEIPIFKFRENKKVKQELEKRHKNQNIVIKRR